MGGQPEEKVGERNLGIQTNEASSTGETYHESMIAFESEISDSQRPTNREEDGGEIYFRTSST